MKAFELFGTIGLKGGEAVGRQLQSINNQAGSTSGTLGRFGATLATIGGSIATAAAAGIAAVGAAAAAMGVQQNAALEQSNVAWTTLLGTQERAADMMERISDFAKTTPFETEHVDAMAKYMHNAGLAGNELFNELMKVSDVASAFAIPAHEAKEMARQMAQVRNAGIAYTEDLNILEDRGVPIIKTIAKQLGITAGEAKAMAGDAEITSEIYLNAFNEIAKGVEGASVAQSQTFNGMIAAMSDTVKIIAAELFEPLFNSLKGVMERVQPMLESVADMLKGGEFNLLDTLKEKFLNILPPEVVEFFRGQFETLQTFWKEHGAAIREAIAQLAELLGPVFKLIFAGALLVVKMVWDSISGIISGFIKFVQGFILILTGLLTGDFGRMWEGVKNIFVGAIQFLWNFFNLLFVGRIVAGVRMLFMSLGRFVAAGWQSIIGFFKSSFDNIAAGAVNWINSVTRVFNLLVRMGTGIFRSFGAMIRKAFSDARGAAVSIAQNLFSRLSGIFSSIRSTASRIFSGIRSAITSPIQTAKNTILGIIETIKNAFNRLKFKIPKPQIPKISVDMIKNKFGIPVPDFNIDWQAHGGIFTSPRIVGISEAGAEAIIPLQNRKFMQPFSQAIAEDLAAMQPAGFSGRVEVPVYLNSREIARAVASDIDQQLARTQQNKYMR